MKLLLFTQLESVSNPAPGSNNITFVRPMINGNGYIDHWLLICVIVALACPCRRWCFICATIIFGRLCFSVLSFRSAVGLNASQMNTGGWNRIAVRFYRGTLWPTTKQAVFFLCNYAYAQIFYPLSVGSNFVRDDVNVTYFSFRIKGLHRGRCRHSQKSHVRQMTTNVREIDT